MVPVDKRGLTLVCYEETGLIGMTIPLERTGTLGREGTLIALSADTRTSRKHATIAVDSGANVLLSDESSKNGTFVNGQRISAPTVLQDNDVIRVGDSVFVLDRLRPPRRAANGLIGSASRLIDVLAELERLAQTDFPILLLGATGVGKEVFARYVHDNSKRAKGKVIAVNCAAITDTLFESELFGHVKGSFTGATATRAGFVEQAKNGTLFLDEIGELLPTQQTKLLRLLETGDYTPVGAANPQHNEARIIAATNANIQSPNSSFRRDLYARLATGVVVLPALKDRKADVLDLADGFLKQSQGSFEVRSLGANVVEKLLAYDWPMNIRELRAVMQRLTLLGTPTEATAMPTLNSMLIGESEKGEEQARGEASPNAARRPPMTVEEFVKVATELEGNVLRLAKHFDVERRQIYRWVEKFQVDLESLRKSNEPE